jgi:hypothetical protein
MTDNSLTFLEFENGDILRCEHPDDALAKIRAMPKVEGVVTMTQKSLPSNFSQTREYDPVSDDWMPSSKKDVK